MKLKFIALSLLLSLGTCNTNASDNGEPNKPQEATHPSPRLQLNLEQATSDDEEKGEQLSLQYQGDECPSLTISQETFDPNESHPLLIEVVTRHILFYLDAQSALRFALSCRGVRNTLDGESTWQSLKMNPPQELRGFGTNLQGIRYFDLKALNQFVTELNPPRENQDLANLTPDVLIASFRLCRAFNANEESPTEFIIRAVVNIPGDRCEIVRLATLLLSRTTGSYTYFTPREGIRSIPKLVKYVGRLGGESRELCSKLKSLILPSQSMGDIIRTLKVIDKDKNRNVVLLSAEDLMNYPNAKGMELFNSEEIYKCFTLLGEDCWVIWSNIKHLINFQGKFGVRSIFGLATLFENIPLYGEISAFNRQNVAALAALGQAGKGLRYFPIDKAPNANLLPVVDRLGQDRVQLCTAAGKLLIGCFIDAQELERLISFIRVIPNYEQLCTLAANFIIDCYNTLEISHKDRWPVLKTFNSLGANLENTLEACNIILKNRFGLYLGEVSEDMHEIWLDPTERLELLQLIHNLGKNAKRTLTLSTKFMSKYSGIHSMKILFPHIQELGSDGESVSSMTQTIVSKLGFKYISLSKILQLLPVIRDLGSDREALCPEILESIQREMLHTAYNRGEVDIEPIIGVIRKKSIVSQE